MATFVLIHGAGDVGWYWHLVEAELRRRGHDVVAPDLPCEDDAAGLSEYADVVVSAIGARRDLVVVGQSFGSFTAALVCERLPVRLLVLLAGMVPAPGERPADWPEHTGLEAAQREDAALRGPPADTVALFYADLPPALAAEAMRRGRRQAATPGQKPWPLRAWTKVPTRFLLCRDDRFFPAAFQRRVVRERLGIVPDELDGSHCVALSRPAALAERLESYLAAATGGA
ncbi:MAG: alpha/beta hydrolase [Anaeromyxobacter sp.]